MPSRVGGVKTLCSQQFFKPSSLDTISYALTNVSICFVRSSTTLKTLPLWIPMWFRGVRCFKAVSAARHVMIRHSLATQCGEKTKIWKGWYYLGRGDCALLWKSSQMWRFLRASTNNCYPTQKLLNSSCVPETWKRSQKLLHVWVASDIDRTILNPSTSGTSNLVTGY